MEHARIPMQDLPDVENLMKEIQSGRADQLQALFARQGSRTPHVQWSPMLQDFNNNSLRQFAKICDGLAGPDGHVALADFSLDHFHGVSKWMQLLDVVGEPNRFRISFYGEGIAETRGISMMGRFTDEQTDTHIGRFSTAVFRSAVTRKERILTIHEPPKRIFARQWERLAVPLLDGAGQVAQLAIIGVPDNEFRAGLELIPDPVIVADENTVVRFANRAAREFFGRQIHLGADMDLFTFAGIEFEFPDTPQNMARMEAVHDSISLVLRDTMIDRFLLTASATEQWRSAFYVVTLRPLIEGEPG